jgi:hypothetical protein
MVSAARGDESDHFPTDIGKHMEKFRREHEEIKNRPTGTSEGVSDRIAKSVI